MSTLFHSAAETRQTTWRDWFNNIRLNLKLLILIGIMLIGSITVTIISGAGLNQLRSRLDNLYNFKLLPITDLKDAETALTESQVHLETLKDPYLRVDEVSYNISETAKHERIAEAAFGRYEASFITTSNPEFTALLIEAGKQSLQAKETVSIKALRQKFNVYMEARTQLFTVIQAGNIDPQLADDVTLKLNDVKDEANQLIDINLQYAKIANDAANDAYTRSMSSMFAAIITTAILGIVLAFIVANSIVNRLEVVSRSAALMQQGRLTKRAEVTGRDEIAQLATSFNSMAAQLNDTLSKLELRVAERTSELEKRTFEIESTSAQLARRATQLQTITDASREIAQVQELADLLPKITDLVSRQFGFYHVGIFLIDANNEYAVLRAANSVGGKMMLTNGHKLKVGETGIVGYVGKTGRPRIALSTGEDAVFFNNPYLPETQSEMALPMKVGNRIIGAIDVQSKEANAFTQEDVSTLTVLADQISVAVENARLFEESNKAAQEAERTYQEYLRRERRTLAIETASAGYMYSEAGMTILEKPIKNEEFDATVASGKVIIKTGAASPSLLSIPIKLRDDVIGILGIRSPEDRSWDQDEIDIVQAIAERVAISVESARLLESSRRRATKEQLIGSITSKIGASINMRAVLQTAVEELGRAIPGSEVTIQFKESSNE